MRRIFIFVFALAMVLGSYMQTHATLIDLGPDSLGYDLIYDTDLNITWYDYTETESSWQNQVNWAASLTVTFGGNTYGGWRLPTTPGITGGYTDEGEMGYLYYTELQNSAGGPLVNTGPFQNVGPYIYWSGTKYGLAYAWDFSFVDGYQNDVNQAYGLFALAVHPGDVSAVPEPGTLLLLSSGLVGLGVYGRKKFLKK